jgi:hypothetical protein
MQSVVYVENLVNRSQACLNVRNAEQLYAQLTAMEPPTIAMQMAAFIHGKDLNDST